MKRRSLLLSLAALGLGLGLRAPARAEQGGQFEVPIQGVVLDPDTQQTVGVGGTAQVHLNFDRPSGGCLHAVVHWQDVFGFDIEPNAGVQWDGRGETQYEQSVNPGQFLVTFPATFNLMADRPGGGCVHVYAQVTIEGSEGVTFIEIVLQP